MNDPGLLSQGAKSTWTSAQGEAPKWKRLKSKRFVSTCAFRCAASRVEVGVNTS